MSRQSVQDIGHFHTAASPGRGQDFSPRNSADWATALEAAYRVCDV